MARRNNSKPVDDFIEVVSFLPPWTCVVLAAAGYFLLHAYATHPISAVTAPSQMSGIAIEAILKGLATAGQYIFPLLCSMAAVLSGNWLRVILGR